MLQTTANNELICPNCGALNPLHARVCRSCKTALIAPAPLPEQPSAMVSADLSRPAPTGFLNPVRREARHMRPAQTLANRLRAIAHGERPPPDEGKKKHWWMNIGIVSVVGAFLVMIRLKGKGVVKNLLDDN